MTIPKRRTPGHGRLSAAGLRAVLTGAALLSSNVTAQPPLTPDVSPVFDRDRLPAAGRQVATLTVPAVGRYSLRAESKSGVAVQVLDRMSGWSEIAGQAGQQDGRLDLFLDPGTVRVVTYGAKLAQGENRLQALSFTERHAAPLPMLPDSGSLTESLADLEMASWWFDVEEPRPFIVEAAGRHLADLRLWRDGEWLVGAEPIRSTVTPEPQRPLELLQLAARLEPGRYRLSAYGGAGQPWTKAANDAPLHLRVGVPRLADTARAWHTVSPFGHDRYLVAGGVDLLRLEIREAREVSLDVWDSWDPGAPFPSADGASTAAIGKDSVPPVAEQRPEAREDGDRLITVRGAAGQAYVLQNLTSIPPIAPLGGRSGEFWLSAFAAGAAQDSLDVTGLVIREHGDGKAEVLAAHAVQVSRAAGWARRFNLVEEVTLHLEVKETGDYQIEARGLPVRARLEPLLFGSEKPERPRLRELPATWSLPAGLYLLTLSSPDQGAVAVAVSGKGARDPRLEWFARGAAPSAAASAAPAAQFGRIRLNARESISLLSSQPGTAVGLQVRPLPADVEEPLTVALAPAQELAVPVVARRPGRLAALGDDGNPSELSVDGGPWSVAAELTSGQHEVHVRNAREVPATVSLALSPEQAQVTSQPAPLASAPPSLTQDSGRFFDVERQTTSTFLLQAAEPSLYRIESSGLLRTAGSLRTRARPVLAEAQENGSGRNFRLATYLRDGEYQVNVQALGDSAGHAGVTVRRAAVRQGGALYAGAPARSWVRADEAVAYAVPIAEAGRYTLRADGLQAPFQMRLEDAEGWPVAKPIETSSVTAELEPGEYRLFVLPQVVDARAVVALQREREEPLRDGHGPHALRLGESANHIWEEPDGAGEREPDRWVFELPAPATVMVALDGEMAGEIRPAGGGAPAARVQPGRTFRGALAQGSWELAVRCSRRNNFVPYSVQIVTQELVSGTELAVDLPATVEVSVAVAGDYEIESTGTLDVRGRLFDGGGRELAASDDRPGDWNFLIARRLEPGRYQLRVNAVGGEEGASKVALRGRRQEMSEALKAPGSRQLQLGEEQIVVPLELPRGAEAVAATASAPDVVALELERESGTGWSTVARNEGRVSQVALPLADMGSGRYRLRLRSPDRRQLAVRLAVWAGKVPGADERALAAGLRLRPLPQLEPPLALSAVDVGRGGCFAVTSAAADLEQSPGAGASFVAAGPTLETSGPKLWLLAAAPGATVTARRVRLGNAERVALSIGPERSNCDLAPASGPRWIRAATVGGGDPVLALDQGGADTTTFVSHGESLTIDADGKARTVALWNGKPAVAEATLESRTFAAPAAERASWGPTSVALDGMARRFTLPAGRKRLRVSLAAGAAALLLRDGRPAGTLWAARKTIEEVRSTDADEILLLPAGTEPTQARFEALPGEGAAPTLDAAARRYEERFAGDGVVRVAIAAGAGGRLRVRGATGAMLVGADGGLQRGDDLDTPAGGGTLWIEHGPGLVAAWVTGGDETLTEWGYSTGESTGVATPATLPLDGLERRLIIDVPEPRILVARPSTPLAAALVTGGQTRFSVLAEAEPFVAYLPAGAAQLLLRGLAGEPLSGSFEILTQPLDVLGEGLAEPTLLAAGGAQGYRFRLDAPARVGAGVRSADAGAESVVFDAAGRVLRRGVVGWLDLSSGEYALALLAPRGGGPVTAQAALVGTTPPGLGPPAEEVRELLGRIGEVESAVGATAFQPAPLPVLLGEDRSAYSSPRMGSQDSAEEYDEAGDDTYEDAEGEGE